MSADFVLPPRRLVVGSRVERKEETRKWSGCEAPGQASTVSEWCTSSREHDEEMRWLAELFQLEELVDGLIPDELADSVLGEWCAAHRDDARALRYLAILRGDELLMEKAPWATLG